MSKNVLVTGTSTGLGRLTALALAARGHKVFATMRDVEGRSREAAEALRRASERIRVVEMDVEVDASVARAVGGVLENAGHLDAVINNAGFAAVGLEETLEPEELRRQFEVNVVGPHRVARAVLPSMRARGAGLVVQVSSGVGRLAIPVQGAYCASKAAVEALFEAYRYELKPTGVEVTIVQPGAFPTDLVRNAVPGKDAARAAGYGPMAHALEGMLANIEQMLSGPHAPDPRFVADAVVALVESAAGSRPARVVVDPMPHSRAPVEALNHAHAEVQRALLGAFGMGSIAD